MWRGVTTREDAERYLQYVLDTGLREYRATPGNRGAWILTRDVEDRAEFVTFSLWDSEDAIARFAGEDIERAVFYPEDDRFLLDRDLTVTHFRAWPATAGEPPAPQPASEG